MSRMSLLISACLYPVKCYVLNFSKVFILRKIFTYFLKEKGGGEVKDILKAIILNY